MSDLSDKVKLNNRYLDELLSLKAAPDIIRERVFPNSKEITESFAAFNAVKNHLKFFDIHDPDITALFIGDGRTPRTALLFAYLTQWNCISIDPKIKNIKYKAKRLKLMVNRIDDCELFTGNKIVAICVHSHAPQNECLSKLGGRYNAMVAIPCCVEYRDFDLSYTDYGIHSDKREVMIWKKVIHNEI